MSYWTELCKRYSTFMLFFLKKDTFVLNLYQYFYNSSIQSSPLLLKDKTLFYQCAISIKRSINLWFLERQDKKQKRKMFASRKATLWFMWIAQVFLLYSPKPNISRIASSFSLPYLLWDDCDGEWERETRRTRRVNSCKSVTTVPTRLSIFSFSRLKNAWGLR